MAQKILIAEDNTSLLNVLADTFTDEGFDVKKAVDGKEALDIAKSWMPDVILLDILMPNMDGKEMLTEFRTVDGSENTIVIVLTNSGNSQQVLDLLSLEVSDYLTKADWELEGIVKKVKERLADR